MSRSASDWAWIQELKPASAKLVLLSLANHHNANTNRCDPSVTTISTTTGLDRKTVMRCLDSLANLGLISTQKRNGTSNRFNLLTSTVIGTSTKNGTSTNNGTGVVPITVLPPVPITVHKPVSKPVKNQYKGIDLSDTPDDLVDQASEFIDHRRNIKKPLTQNAYSRFLTAVSDAATNLNLSPAEVISETIDAGWQSVKTEWLKNRLGVNHAKVQSGGNPGTNGGKQTPAQRTKSKRDAIHRRELAERASAVGTVDSPQ